MEEYNSNDKQRVAFEKVDEAAFAKFDSERCQGYGRTLGIVICANNTCGYKRGCSVASIASARRTATMTVTFTTVIRDSAGVMITQASVTATVSARSLSGNITAVIIRDTDLSLVVAPVEGEIGEVGEPSVTTADPSGADSPLASLLRALPKHPDPSG